jgi:energy-coupling factor transport system ATP-binding protein
VFQHPERQLFAQTIGEDILFGPKNLGMPVEGEAGKRIIEQTLSVVGLIPRRFKGRSPFSLSGGEARRAAIATVLALDTDFLLLDEPTAGLDARGKAFVIELLNNLLCEGKGIVVATHDPGYFAGLATHWLELQEQ